jgi:hypothetical protein
MRIAFLSLAFGQTPTVTDLLGVLFNKENL